MNIPAVLGILSSAIVIVGGIPYLKDIHNKKVHPHILSWLGWGGITALGGAAMLAEGSGWITALLFGNTVLCLSIALFAIFKKVGIWSTTIYDYVFFMLGIIGLILWQTLHLPIIALICAIAADLFFGIPTVIKTYKDPSTETPAVWFMSMLSELLALAALQHITFSELAYPIYLLLYDTTLLVLVLKREKYYAQTQH